MTILLNIFVLPFIGKNIYRSIVINPKSDVGKDAIYEFMRSSNFGWRRFLLKLAFGVHEFIDGLTSKDRESVLILDDSTIERPRSKKVELLAKVHDQYDRAIPQRLQVAHAGLVRWINPFTSGLCAALFCEQKATIPGGFQRP